jgi:hypothetical protein
MTLPGVRSAQSPVLVLTRAAAGRHQALADRITGTPMPDPHRPVPEAGWLVRLQARAEHPMTWRELLWTVAAATAGFARALLAQVDREDRAGAPGRAGRGRSCRPRRRAPTATTAAGEGRERPAGPGLGAKRSCRPAEALARRAEADDVHAAPSGLASSRRGAPARSIRSSSRWTSSAVANVGTCSVPVVMSSSSRW